MAALPYMQFYIADYLADTAHLDVTEHGAYLLLIMTYWQRGKPLPNDDVRLARIARCSKEQWAAVRPHCEEFFDVTDVWRHKRIDADLKAVNARSDQVSGAAKSRWNKKKTRHANALRTHMRTQCDTDTDIYTPQTPHRGAFKSGFEKGSKSDLSAMTADAWDKAIDRYRQFVDGRPHASEHPPPGVWSDRFGKPPGYPGCRAPADILNRHGFEPRRLQ